MNLWYENDYIVQPYTLTGGSQRDNMLEHMKKEYYGEDYVDPN